MSSILMCDKCGNVFRETSHRTKVTIDIERADGGYYSPRLLGREYDLCDKCTKEVIEMFDAPKQLETETVRL